MIEHLEAIALSDVWNIFQEKTEEKISYMFSHRDSVCCVMFVERSSRHQDAHAKKALKLESPLSITSWKFSEPGFRILTKGVIRQPKLEGPCSNSIQVLGIEQPSLDLNSPLQAVS